MKLIATTRAEEQKTKKEEAVKRGKNAKRKGGQYERDIANKLQKRYGIELKRTPRVVDLRRSQIKQMTLGET